MAPAMTTRKPAPAESETSVTRSVQPGVGALGVVGERVLGLGDADRQATEAQLTGPLAKMRWRALGVSSMCVGVYWLPFRTFFMRVSSPASPLLHAPLLLRARAVLAGAAFFALWAAGSLGAAPTAEIVAEIKQAPTTPTAALTVGADGNLYGTTLTGGASNNGTIFRLSPAGELTTLVHFNGTNGANPWGALTLGPDGNFYGTTSDGGAGVGGTFFRLSPAGALTTLASLASIDGRSPYAPVTLGADGNFYGTTSQGGASGLGTVFRASPAGVLTKLVEFTGTTGPNRGMTPRYALTLGADGNL